MKNQICQENQERESSFDPKKEKKRRWVTCGTCSGTGSVRGDEGELIICISCAGSRGWWVEE